MVYLFRSFTFYLILSLLAGCATSKKAAISNQTKDDGKIQIAILQMNDVYEIGGLDGGKVGGLARVYWYHAI